MTPESFNAALAQRKLEAIDILLIQAKRGSDADRIRAASAILRIAFFPTVASASSRCSAKPSAPEPPQRTQRALSASSGEAPSTPSATDTHHQPPHAPRTAAELALGAPMVHANARPNAAASSHTLIEHPLVNSS